MAFFKFRKGTDETSSTPMQPPSVEVIRQRAKYRLVGATVLVLAGVICLPLLLESQPRPVALNMPIEIPDKNKMVPLVIPGSSAVPASAQGSAAAPTPAIVTESAEPTGKPASDSQKNRTVTLAAPALAASKSIAVDPVKSATKASESARARALLEATDSQPASAVAKATQAKVTASKTAEPEAAAVEGRFVVQVGAFAEGARAHEVRLKLEGAGMKTYTHVAETKEGRRIRVRVGPFSTRAEAEKSAEKVKKLNLPAALLTL